MTVTRGDHILKFVEAVDFSAFGAQDPVLNVQGLPPLTVAITLEDKCYLVPYRHARGVIEFDVSGLDYHGIKSIRVTQNPQHLSVEAALKPFSLDEGIATRTDRYYLYPDRASGSYRFQGSEIDTRLVFPDGTSREFIFGNGLGVARVGMRDNEQPRIYEAADFEAAFNARLAEQFGGLVDIRDVLRPDDTGLRWAVVSDYDESTRYALDLPVSVSEVSIEPRSGGR